MFILTHYKRQICIFFHQTTRTRITALVEAINTFDNVERIFETLQQLIRKSILTGKNQQRFQ